MSKPVIRIGTRASALALVQTGEIRRRLEHLHPRRRFRLVKIRTVGDEFKSVELFKKTGVGVFTKAIERKLLQNQIDLAVHSLKDLPTSMPKGLALAAIPKRLATRDVLVSAKRYSIQTLPRHGRVGTGSLRRAAQLLLHRPDLQIVPIRGNLGTRVAQALDKKLDAVILAEAGLRRLGRYARYQRSIPERHMLPAVGQGTLALQSRANDSESIKIARSLHHAPTALLANAERMFLKTLRGGCRVPVGVSSHLTAGKCHFEGAIFSIRSAALVRGTFRAPASRALDAARQLALNLLQKGGRKLLAQARA